MWYMRHMIHTRETQQLVTFLGRARVDFQIFCMKKSYVFICFIDIASWNCWNYTVFGRISICARGGRAHVHFVSFFARDDGPGTCASVIGEVRSTWKSCSQKPVSQKCLKSGGFPRNPQERAGWHFDNFLEKQLGFWCFYVKIVTKPKVLEGFRLARANVHFTLFFARDSWSLVMLEQGMSTLAYFFARENERQQNNRILYSSFCLRLSHENEENVAAA